MYQTKSGVATLPLIERTSRRNNKYVVRFGCEKEVPAEGEQDMGESYIYLVEDFVGKPAFETLKPLYEDYINRQTDMRIYDGFVWEGKKVWLDLENQFNFKAAYDLAVQKNGATLPVTFKIGEDDEKNPVYYTFGTMEEIDDFYTKAVQYINSCLKEGWKTKDRIDWQRMKEEYDAL